jgi:hypothetical protein
MGFGFERLPFAPVITGGPYWDDIGVVTGYLASAMLDKSSVRGNDQYDR